MHDLEYAVSENGGAYGVFQGWASPSIAVTVQQNVPFKVKVRRRFLPEHHFVKSANGAAVHEIEVDFDGREASGSISFGYDVLSQFEEQQWRAGQRRAICRYSIAGFLH